VAVKRLFDIALASVLLVVAAPVMALVALLVRVNLGRPVLFRQVRPGLHGRGFEFVKFRTMRDLRDERGDYLPNEARTTPFGLWLRSTSLDELPELWSVLKGDMSLVGPRPLLMEYLPLYTAEQRRRHDVRPGLTGWAQVNGRNAVPWEERFRMDVWYVDHRSLRLDLRILFMTVWRIVSRQGISVPGRSTIERYRSGD
jgi:lipopolysaccharide/colanic/teichoic acid biosynthesis glycosyltransferase